MPGHRVDTSPTHDRKAAFAHSGVGRVCDPAHSKNTRIIHYAGEKITNRESLRREKRYLKKGHIWCFKLNRLYVRDAAVGGNIARYINHACEPNCYTQVIDQTIWIRAARNIRRGEELTYDYSTDGEGHPLPLPAGLPDPDLREGRMQVSVSARLRILRRARRRRRS